MARNSTIGLALITVFEKVLGLAKNLLFSTYYGTSNISDAFNIAVTIPDTFYALFGSGVNSSFIPLYESRPNREKNEFTCKTITATLILTSTLALLGMMGSGYIVGIFAPGFDSDTESITVQLVSISIWSVVFCGVNNLLISYLQTHKVFMAPELTNTVLNVLQCLGILVSVYYGYKWLATGILFGNFIQLVLLLGLSYRNGLSFRLTIPNYDTIREILLIAIPIFISASANRFNLIIDKAIASSTVEGGVSALAYADNLILFVKGIFGMPFITIAFPIITKLINEDSERVNTVVGGYIEGMLFYILPITIGFMYISSSIVSVVYERGAFDAESVRLTSDCLRWYSLGLPAFCIRDMLVKVYYARKDSRTPTVNMIIGISINIVLNIVLSRLIGLEGLALSSSIAAYIIVIILYIGLVKTNSFTIESVCIKTIVKICTSSIIMVFVLCALREEISSLPPILITLLSMAIGFVTYIVSMIVTRTYTLNQIRDRILMRR